MNILVCGSHTRGSKQHVFDSLDNLSQWFPVSTCIVHGGAKFIDTFAGQWAEHNGYCSIRVNANWNFYGNNAGPIRNGWMLEFIKIDLVIAFDGDSGTKSMIKLAKSQGVTVHES
jgi:hypothetical protein